MVCVFYKRGRRMEALISNNGWANQFLVTGDRSIISSITTIYGAGCTNNLVLPTIHICIKRIDTHYLIEIDKQKTYVTNNYLMYVNNIVFARKEYLTNVLPLHSGAVEYKGKAYLFVAATGTGKSTLVSYLTECGFTYIDDDEIIIDMITDQIIPASHPICLRPNSIPILSSYNCMPNCVELRVGNYHRMVYSPKLKLVSPAPIDRIFFLERNASKNHCQKIKFEDAVSSILQSLSSPAVFCKERISYAIKLAKQCELLQYSDLHYVVELFKALIT